MSWIDVAILALVVLIGLLGVWRGVKKSALSLGAFLISFLLAFFLANVIAEAFLGIDSIKSFVLGNGFDAKSTWSLAKWIYGGTAGKTLGDTSYLGLHFYKPILDIVNSTNVGVSQEVGFALYGAFMMFSAICGVGIFIVVRLLLIIVTVIVNTYISKKKSVVSRLFGFVLGAIRGALWVFAFTIVFSCFGGYTFVSGINSIQKEYENNAVVCNYFNDGAYGMRNGLLLPDKDTYGRIVEMVYKKQSTTDPNAEKLSGDRLNLFINVSNLNYDNNPWSITELKKRSFDVAGARERKAAEFTSTGFDTVVQAILDYNQSIADTVDDTTKLKELTAAQFETLNFIVAPSDDSYNMDVLMTALWRNLRQYEKDYNKPAADTELSVLNSTLAADYNAITEAITSIKEKYKQFESAFGEFPTLELPQRKQLDSLPNA